MTKYMENKEKQIINIIPESSDVPFLVDFIRSLDLSIFEVSGSGVNFYFSYNINSIFLTWVYNNYPPTHMVEMCTLRLDVDSDTCHCIAISQFEEIRIALRDISMGLISKSNKKVSIKDLLDLASGKENVGYQSLTPTPQQLYEEQLVLRGLKKDDMLISTPKSETSTFVKLIDEFANEVMRNGFYPHNEEDEAMNDMILRRLQLWLKERDNK